MKERRGCGRIRIGAVEDGRRLALHPSWEEVMQMITYSELFQFCLVIIGIVALFQGKRK